MLVGTQAQYNKVFRNMITQLKRGADVVIYKWDPHLYQYCYNYIFGFKYKLHLRLYELFFDSRVEFKSSLSEYSKKVKGIHRSSFVIGTGELYEESKNLFVTNKH